MRLNILYVDPPWQYEQNRLSGVAEKHYRTLTDEEIYSLPVGDIAAENCILFLWATGPKLREAFKAISSWGFDYRTLGFVWVKQNRKSPTWFFGLGFWTRSSTEVCLLAVKGKPRRVFAKVSQLIVSPLEEHSKKPDVVRDRIVELMGNLPRAELFARKKSPGWFCIGDEVDGMDIRDSIAMLKNMKEENDGGDSTF